MNWTVASKLQLLKGYSGPGSNHIHQIAKNILFYNVCFLLKLRGPIIFNWFFKFAKTVFWYESAYSQNAMRSFFRDVASPRKLQTLNLLAALAQQEYTVAGPRLAGLPTQTMSSIIKLYTTNSPHILFDDKIFELYSKINSSSIVLRSPANQYGFFPGQF